MKTFIYLITLLFCILFMAMKQTTSETISDIDGNKYQVKKIGSYKWMTENLRTTKFRDGTPIKKFPLQSQWGKEKKPGWTYSKNDSIYNVKYGKIYNGYAITNKKGICPKGWHVPTDAEWIDLFNALGSAQNCAPKLMSKEWKESGRNTSGFNLHPTGIISTNMKFFRGIENSTSVWTSTKKTNETFVIYYFLDGNENASLNTDSINNGNVCRCVENH